MNINYKKLNQNFVIIKRPPFRDAVGIPRRCFTVVHACTPAYGVYLIPQDFFVRYEVPHTVVRERTTVLRARKK